LLAEACEAVCALDRLWAWNCLFGVNRSRPYQIGTHANTLQSGFRKNTNVITNAEAIVCGLTHGHLCVTSPFWNDTGSQGVGQLLKWGAYDYVVGDSYSVVIAPKRHGSPTITKDGVTVAKEIELKMQ